MWAPVSVVLAGNPDKLTWKVTLALATLLLESRVTLAVTVTVPLPVESALVIGFGRSFAGNSCAVKTMVFGLVFDGCVLVLVPPHAAVSTTSATNSVRARVMRVAP